MTDRRFSRDVLYNVASIGVLGVGGIVINAVIARGPGFDALGSFNQVFAIYIFMSQLSVGGIHFSVLSHVARSPEDRGRCADIVTAALTLTLGLSIVAAALAWLGADVAGAILDSPDVAYGLRLAAPGLVFFALNKVLLNTLNGARSMRAYAVFQAMRFVLLLGAIVTLVLMRVEGRMLALALTIAEGLLLVGLLADVNLRLFRLVPSSDMGPWFREHVSFGTRGFLSGVLGEVNTRVDVLMLGYFFGDTLVGVYSFAAIIAEGFSQLPMVVRRNVDPILGRHFAEGDLAGIGDYARRLRRVVYPAIAGIGVLSIAVYPAAYYVLVGEGDWRVSWIVYAILAAGIVAGSGYRPFLGLTLQGGRPGVNTLLIAALVLSNIVLNAVLIPWLGIYGAAAATAIVFVIEALLIILVARALFGVRV